MVTPAKIEKQLSIERDMISNGIIRFYAQNEAKSDSKSTTSYGSKLLKTSIADVAEAIGIYLESNKKVRRKSPGYAPISLLSTDVSSYITVKFSLDNITGGPLTGLAVQLGHKIEDQVRFDAFEQQEKANKAYLDTLKTDLASRNSIAYHHKKLVFADAERKMGFKWEPFEEERCLKIGTILFECLISSTGLFELDKRTVKKGRKLITQYFLLPTEETINFIKDNLEAMALQTPEFMPCVIPPKPWSAPADGGYHLPALNKKLRLVSHTDRRKARIQNRMINRADMSLVYKSINTLQNVSWRINKDVYEVLKYAFDNGHDWGISKSIPEIAPECPLGDGETLKEFPELEQAFKDWKVSKRKYHEQELIRATEALRVSSTIRIAEKYLNDDTLYFVWRCDFRGRKYAVSTFLNPQGEDISKGLIQFAKAEPITNKLAFDNLCIYAAGEYGYDKTDLDDRIAWVYANKNEFMALAHDPIANRFWVNADKPYQFLAVAIEIGQIFELMDTGKDWRKFESRVCVYVDGKCNGSQHYAAMTRDEVVGKTVSLIDSDIPGDIYQVVCDRAMQLMIGAPDCELKTKWLQANPDRKMTKRAVMIVPYNGGKRTACDHIRTWINENCPDLFGKATKSVDESGKVTYSGGPLAAAVYMGEFVWQAILDTNIRGMAARDWMAKISRTIALAAPTDDDLEKGNVIAWVAPNGFPVLHRELKTKSVEVDTHLFGRICLTLNKDINEIDSRRMSLGFAPNFNHSLDASHLDFMVCEMEASGVSSLGVVHDSFGCHARYVGDLTNGLHKVIRDTFIKLHGKTCLFEEFYAQQLKMHPELADVLPKLSDFTDLGTLDLNQVLSSRHFFR